MERNLLSIAGFDPSGGAGVLLDVRVFEALGFHGTSVVTALTVQNTAEVLKVIALSARSVSAQYRALARDMAFAGIKVGMIGSRAALPALMRILAGNPAIPRVVDPVLRSSSGAPLFEGRGIPAFLRAIRERASLITPNMAEASALAGFPVRSPAEMKDAAEKVFDLTAVPCLVKGGHLATAVVDVLFDGRRTILFGHEKLERDVRGTGCFLSSALLGHLARGRSLERACGLAADMVHSAILGARKAGKGRLVFGSVL